jgi:hypothetical protein
MNAFLSTGIWSSPSQTYPGEFEFMAIDTTTMRIVTFVVIEIDPIKRVPMKTWYRQTEPGIIDVRLKPTSEWKSHSYTIEGNTIYWIMYAKEYPWINVPENNLPEWFRDRLTQAHARMDLQEKEAEQGAAANP